MPQKTKTNLRPMRVSLTCRVLSLRTSRTLGPSSYLSPRVPFPHSLSYPSLVDAAAVSALLWLEAAGVELPADVVEGLEQGRERNNWL